MIIKSSKIIFYISLLSYFMYLAYDYNKNNNLFVIETITIEGNEKSIVVTYVTLVNLISGEIVIDLSNYDEFNSIVVDHYFLPGPYEVTVTIENDVLFLSYERDIRVR